MSKFTPKLVIRSATMYGPGSNIAQSGQPAFNVCISGVGGVCVFTGHHERPPELIDPRYCVYYPRDVELPSCELHSPTTQCGAFPSPTTHYCPTTVVGPPGQCAELIRIVPVC